jgi:hypothetical protein
MSDQGSRLFGFPGLQPMFGAIGRVWHVRNAVERVAIVEEVSAEGRWWVLYLMEDAGWLVMGTFVVDDERVLSTVPRFAEVVDVAVPVDGRHPFYLVVEEDEEYMWWVVYWTRSLSVGIHVVFVVRKEEYVVLI